jgi:hypothetical protein
MGGQACGAAIDGAGNATGGIGGRAPVPGEEKAGMTADEIGAEIERIRAKAIAGDNEEAHSAEDRLRARVLRFIADGKADDPQLLALLVLETSKIDFQRWYA